MKVPQSYLISHFSHLLVSRKVTGGTVFTSQLGLNLFPAALGAVIETEPEAFRVFVIAAIVLITLMFATAYWIGKSIKKADKNSAEQNQ